MSAHVVVDELSRLSGESDRYRATALLTIEVSVKMLGIAEAEVKKLTEQWPVNAALRDVMAEHKRQQGGEIEKQRLIEFVENYIKQQNKVLAKLPTVICEETLFRIALVSLTAKPIGIIRKVTESAISSDVWA